MPPAIDSTFAHIHLTRPVFEQMANKWAMPILVILHEAPARFNAIKRHLDPITHKVLTDTLRRLEKAGLIERLTGGSACSVVEYAITPLGRSLREAAAVLVYWAQQHGERVTQARRAYRDDAKLAGSA